MKNKEEFEEIESGYERRDCYNPESLDLLAQGYANMITVTGEDMEREGLQKTPVRAAKAFQFLTHGYHLSPEDILRGALFEETYKQPVIVKDIEIFSLCEHHLLPFYGKAHVGYIPNGKIVGLSKIPRMVEALSRRLQLQERLTMQIQQCMENVLSPLGVAVVIEARHLCVAMRGVQKGESKTFTSAFTGIFHEKAFLQQQFLYEVRDNDGVGW